MGFRLVTDGMCLMLAPLDLAKDSVAAHLRSPAWRTFAFTAAVASDPSLRYRESLPARLAHTGVPHRVRPRRSGRDPARVTDPRDPGRRGMAFRTPGRATGAVP